MRRAPLEFTNSETSSDTDFDPEEELTTQLAEAVWEKFLGSLQSQTVLPDDDIDADFNPAFVETEQVEDSVWSGFVANVLNDSDSLSKANELCDQVQAGIQLCLQTVILCQLCPHYQQEIEEMTMLVSSLAEKAEDRRIPDCPTRTEVRQFLLDFPQKWQESISSDIVTSYLIWDLPFAVTAMVRRNAKLFPRVDLFPTVRFQPPHRLKGPAPFCQAEDELLRLANQRFSHFGVTEDRIFMIQLCTMPARTCAELDRRLRRLKREDQKKT